MRVAGKRGLVIVATLSACATGWDLKLLGNQMTELEKLNGPRIDPFQLAALEL